MERGKNKNLQLTVSVPVCAASSCSKPIRITDEMKTETQAEFTALLEWLKMSDGEIRYIKAYTYKDATAILWLTPLAYSKTVALINAFSDEVAWHGMAVRKSENEFVIEDIFVYPQEVTGSTVNTDQTRYAEWMYEFNDDDFNKIRMQGHCDATPGEQIIHSPSCFDMRLYYLDGVLGRLSRLKCNCIITHCAFSVWF